MQLGPHVFKILFRSEIFSKVQFGMLEFFRLPFFHLKKSPGSLPVVFTS